MTVSVRGTGVAAATCAHLLDVRPVSAAEGFVRSGLVPAVMLSGAALALLRDVHGRPDLFAGRPGITRRIVAWGGREPVSVPHEGIVLSDRIIQQDLSAPYGSKSGDAALPEIAESIRAQAFTIFAEGPLPGGEQRVFGERAAVAVAVKLTDPSVQAECRVEALEQGWLFLLPAAPGEGWLLAFGGLPDTLLRQSRLIAPVVGVCGDVSTPFLTAPRMATVLNGTDWLACGSPALGFDPICGDGTAQAVREAVLGAAVVRGIAGGGNRHALLTHYASMLLAGMRRHLQLCAQFYATGGQGPWWQAQSAALAAGYEACTQMLALMPEPRFVLRGFSLEPAALAK